MATLRIELNGTDANPWHAMSLKQNPFPQLARFETDHQVRRIQALGGDPIPNAEYIRVFLKGFVTQELIDLCVSRFEKGKLVRFNVYWQGE